MLWKSKATGRRRVATLSGDRRGSIAILAAVMIPVLLGVTGLTVDVGLAYVAKRKLQDDTQAAALAGAAALARPNATQQTVSAAVAAWQRAGASGNVAVSSTTVELVCEVATEGLPTCSASSPNVVKVTQMATLPTYFLKALGKGSIGISAAVAAAKAGGESLRQNVMFVFDLTGSMHVPDACTIPDRTRPTKIQCALYAVQEMLKVMPTSFNKVGLMFFPGLGKQWSPTSRSCGTKPDAIPYLTPGIRYQIGTTLDDTYNDGAGSLVDESPIIVAVGNAPRRRGCLEQSSASAVNSYAAEVIAKAQAALPVEPGVQNVIVFVSDGNYNAWRAQLNERADKEPNQCAQAVEAAGNAKTAGTTIFSVAWGAAASTGCPFDATYKPCATMKAIASDPTRFYTTTSDCQVPDAVNAVGQLPAIFPAIRTTMTKPRVISLR